MLNYFIIEWLVKLLCLSGHNRKGANRTMKVKRPLWEQRNMFGPRIKIMWEEQLVDSPTPYIIVRCQGKVSMNLHVCVRDKTLLVLVISLDWMWEHVYFKNMFFFPFSIAKKSGLRFTKQHIHSFFFYFKYKELDRKVWT